jgi:hypothetical protein
MASCPSGPRLTHPLSFVEFENVALLEIVKARDANAALKARLDILNVFLKTLERIELALKDLLPSAQNADGGGT